MKLVVKNLGVYFDSALKFDKQISTVVKTIFFHLRVLAKVKPFLSFKDFEKVIHAFISSRLNYCNSLYMGINQASLNRLQMVQNAAARLLTGVRKREHITPVLISLHWLPIRYRIDFIVLLLVYIYIYAFSRHFYPKRLTVHSGYTCFITMCVPWESNPQPFALLTQCSTTEPQEHYKALRL